jgi:hypothetical protein
MFRSSEPTFIAFLILHFFSFIELSILFLNGEKIQIF